MVPCEGHFLNIWSQTKYVKVTVNLISNCIPLIGHCRKSAKGKVRGRGAVGLCYGLNLRCLSESQVLDAFSLGDRVGHQEGAFRGASLSPGLSLTVCFLVCCDGCDLQPMILPASYAFTTFTDRSSLKPRATTYNRSSISKLHLSGTLLWWHGSNCYHLESDDLSSDRDVLGQTGQQRKSPEQPVILEFLCK